MSKQKVVLDVQQFWALWALILAIYIWQLIIWSQLDRIGTIILDAPQSVQLGLEDPDANNAALEGWRVTMVREANDAE